MTSEGYTAALNVPSGPPINPDMWKEEDVTAQRSIPTPKGTSTEPAFSAPRRQSAAGQATLGQTVAITGDLRANEDLTIEGHIEGTIESRLHSVTIGQMGLAKPQILAREVVVLGKVNGSITASEKVEIWPNGSVQSDVVSPTVTIAEGATFRGSIDMPRAVATSESRVAEQPVAAATADVGRPAEKAHRLLETEIPVAAEGALPRRQDGTAQKEASHAA